MSSLRQLAMLPDSELWNRASDMKQAYTRIAVARRFKLFGKICR
jgi:hypothetical protein